MAMWVSIQSFQNKKFLKLKIKGGARFAISENRGNWYEEVEQTKIVNGSLKSIKTKVFVYDGNDINTISLELIDNDVTYIVDINNESSIGRSVISSLLSIQELGKIIQLSLYSKKYTDKKGEPATSDAIGVNYNWENLKWFYNIADKTDESGLPAVTMVKIKGKDTYDSFARDVFLLDTLKSFVETLPEPTVIDVMPSLQSVTQKIEGVTELVKATPVEEINIEDIPF